MGTGLIIPTRDIGSDDGFLAKYRAVFKFPGQIDAFCTLLRTGPDSNLMYLSG